MVTFDQLRISDDGRKMYIDVHVNPVSNFYLDNIVIMTADKVSETAPDVPLKDSEGNYVDYIYYAEFKDNLREASLVLGSNDFNVSFSKANLSSDLFFVYVKCKRVDGKPVDYYIPCRLDEETTLGITFDYTLFYQKAMNYTKDLVKNCEIPMAFTDFILLWNAFKVSVETEHYLSAIRFYNLMFDISRGGHTTIKNCGCHG